MSDTRSLERSEAADAEAAWAAYFDAVDASLDRLAQRLHAASKLDDLPVPEGLGPLPSALAERARLVLARTEDTAAAVAAAMSGTAQELDRLAVVDPRGPRQASHFDTRM